MKEKVEEKFDKGQNDEIYLENWVKVENDRNKGGKEEKNHLIGDSDEEKMWKKKQDNK